MFRSVTHYISAKNNENLSETQDLTVHHSFSLARCQTAKGVWFVEYLITEREKFANLISVGLVTRD